MAFFFFFFLHPPRCLPSSSCRRLENVCCRGQEQKVLHSSVERVQISSLGLVVILSMEKDNNLDFFHSLFPTCRCHEWSGLLNYRLPYQVRAVWGWKGSHSYFLHSTSCHTTELMLSCHHFIATFLYCNFNIISHICERQSLTSDPAPFLEIYYVPVGMCGSTVSLVFLPDKWALRCNL